MAPMDDVSPLQFADLPLLFPDFAASERWLSLLQRHAALLLGAAPAVRVTSVPPEEFPRRHYAECLELWRVVRAESSGSLIVDVGTGGGFPGLVIAAVAPEVTIHLVEPLKKRARLLLAMAAELGLANVSVHPLRAEEAGRGLLRDSADIVIARAVAQTRELLEYTAPLCRRGGLIALAKGSAGPEEIADAGRALAMLHCSHTKTVPLRAEISETVRVMLLRKDGPTHPKYPRQPGAPGKFPL